jgi:hypothetical protein
LTPAPASGVLYSVEGMVRHPLRAVVGVVAALVLCGLSGCGRGEDDRSVPRRCGDEFAKAGRGPGLTLTGSFPARARATERTFEARVTVRNDADARIEVLSASAPDVYVTRSRKIVATPLVRDQLGLQLTLAPGEVREFTAAGGLRSCRDGRPLPPGRYEIHAVLVIVATNGVVEAVGGPWSLEISE